MNGTCAVQQHHHTGATTTGGLVRTTRRQCLSAIEIVTLVAIGVLLIVGAVSARPLALTATATQTVQVQAGETLWSIAASHPITGLTTAQAAQSISRSNRLATSTLRAGQTLLVPVAADRAPQVASR